MPSIYQDKQCRLQRSERKFHSGGNASSEQLDRRQSAEAVPLLRFFARESLNLSIPAGWSRRLADMLIATAAQGVGGSGRWN